MSMSAPGPDRRLHTDLLDQAQKLVLAAIRDDSEAGLRRAVSTAYYALFHLLLTEAAAMMAPPQPPGLRLQARRAFSHSEMRAVCALFASGIGPKAKSLPPTMRLLVDPIEKQLLAVIRAFELLQNARTTADYDLAFSVTELWALEEVERAKEAFANWEGVRTSPNAAVFLLALALHRSWSKGNRISEI